MPIYGRNLYTFAWDGSNENKNIKRTAKIFKKYIDCNNTYIQVMCICKYSEIERTVNISNYHSLNSLDVETSSPRLEHKANKYVFIQHTTW